MLDVVRQASLTSFLNLLRLLSLLRPESIEFHIITALYVKERWPLVVRSLGMFRFMQDLVFRVWISDRLRKLQAR